MVVSSAFNVPATVSVSLWDGSAQKMLRGATLRQMLKTKLAFSLSHTILTLQLLRRPTNTRHRAELLLE